MRAAFVDRYGPPDVLQVRDVPQPRVGTHDVLVAVHASPVTAGDLRMRAADFPALTRLPGLLFLGVRRPRRPIPGTFFAGRVAAVGPAVTRYAVGDDVFGFSGHGAQAAFVALHEDAPMARVPDGVSADEAAATPYGAYTALYFLRDLGRLQPGERVLVVGASGGVGRFAVQLARHLGAEVTAVCGARGAEVVRALGAHRVIDHHQASFTAGDVRYDLILDVAGVTSLAACRPVLAPTGRFLTLHLTLRVLFDVLAAWWRGGPTARTGAAFGTRETMEELGRLLATGVIRPVIDRRLPLERISEAHAAVAAGAPGAVIVTIGTPS